MACNVAPGDVVKVSVRGDNGETKVRFCVVMERVPPGVPNFVLMMFCCGQTKHGAFEDEVFRVDAEKTIERMNLDYASSFHLEDVVAAAASSPALKKIGSAPRDELLELKRMYQIWKAQKRMPKYSPPERPTPAVVEMIAQHLGADTTKPN